MLSSNILEKQFGETKIVILKQNDTFRIIQTIAVNNGQVLEQSLVTFDPANVHIFADVHAQVVDGTSIGKAFRDAGIDFIRDVHSVTRQVLPQNLQSAFTSPEPATIVDVDILVGEQKNHYCHILEIYNPVVVWPPSDRPVSDDLASQLDEFSHLL